jgi:nitroimidazol reductase NimA-like FMN-containing flavoprotein (pyridoxamine 5'-phosphate oxidase superfamily)
MKSFKTPKTKVQRLPSRGHYDEETIFRILDAGFLCHVAFEIDHQPYIIPTAYGRNQNTLFLHGSAKSRMLTHLKNGAPAAISVTHLDGLVLARSTFNSSMNYRSVVILASGQEVIQKNEKMEALRLITEQIIPQRWEEARIPDDDELKATMVLSFQIDEASAKIRTGPPGDKASDYALDIWAGVLPYTIQYADPVADPKLRAGIDLPISVQQAFQNGIKQP